MIGTTDTNQSPSMDYLGSSDDENIATRITLLRRERLQIRTLGICRFPNFFVQRGGTCFSHTFGIGATARELRGLQESPQNNVVTCFNAVLCFGWRII